jgi:hypothetical protein
VVSGEYNNVSFIHEIAGSAVDDVTAEILAEAAIPAIQTTGADPQADRFDHARDLRKHETDKTGSLNSCREISLPSPAAS